MDLRQLRYFVAVAEDKSFTRAAERLNMAQPPLSRQIQQLEAEVGAQLIDRVARPLRLTAIGQLVYEQAVQMLAKADALSAMIGRARAAEPRRLVIGFVASTIYAGLPQFIRQLRSIGPHLELSLLEMVSLEQITALKAARIDVGFGRIRFEDEAIKRVVLREERLVAAIPASHPLASAPGPVALAALADLPLIVYPREPRPSYADQVLAAFRDYGLSPRLAHEVRELQIALGLVAAEEGVCIVPESVRRSGLEGVRYRDLLEAATSPIFMTCRKNDASPELELVAEAIKGTPLIEG